MTSKTRPIRQRDSTGHKAVKASIRSQLALEKRKIRRQGSLWVLRSISQPGSALKGESIMRIEACKSRRPDCDIFKFSSAFSHGGSQTNKNLIWTRPKDLHAELVVAYVLNMWGSHAFTIDLRTWLASTDAETLELFFENPDDIFVTEDLLRFMSENETPNVILPESALDDILKIRVLEIEAAVNFVNDKRKDIQIDDI